MCCCSLPFEKQAVNKGKLDGTVGVRGLRVYLRATPQGIGEDERPLSLLLAPRPVVQKACLDPPLLFVPDLRLPEVISIAHPDSDSAAACCGLLRSLDSPVRPTPGSLGLFFDQAIAGTLSGYR